ncbi:Fe(3+) ABC transporter substrate-binding protein [Oceanobacillus salinisoli]|uniref:Fe(3+) ABC transporter substrate-binding protein n=1 Tax=Oceanobacillus salinisoli TaxID=2678611 RepID=UPI0012E26270|nr:Fe(3+) ABC transporter substrate-binding protein [Oceanobacillus salinisoli]
MRNSKIFLFICTTLFLAVFLTACGNSESTSGSSESTDDSAETEQSSEDAATDASQEGEGEVNIYTARHYEVDDKVYERFTDETGIKVNVVKGDAPELIERIKREGESSPADLFITVDGGVLAHAKQEDILQPIQSDAIEENVPELYRDEDNNWVGMSTRARVIVYAKDRVSPEELSTYEDLASEQWEDKLLIRSSTSLYNQSLLASLIELNGEEEVEAWAEGIVNNFARNPDGGDRDQAKAIAAGTGDVGIMNTYYVGLMANSENQEEVDVADQLGVFFPNQDTTGTHINISGIGLTKHSPNTENAIQLIEYITSADIQEFITSQNYEYPVNPDAEWPELLQSWGEFKPQEISWDALLEHNQKAIEISNKVGWQ